MFFFIYLFLPQGLVSLSILRFFLKRIRIIAGDAGFEQVQKSGALLMSHHISTNEPPHLPNEPPHLQECYQVNISIQCTIVYLKVHCGLWVIVVRTLDPLSQCYPLLPSLPCCQILSGRFGQTLPNKSRQFWRMFSLNASLFTE